MKQLMTDEIECWIKASTLSIKKKAQWRRWFRCGRKSAFKELKQGKKTFCLKLKAIINTCGKIYLIY